jgi:hypothetical protein
MKPEIICGVKTIGPWGKESFCPWKLFGAFPGKHVGPSDGMSCWGDTCLTLTGHAEPGEPVRTLVPVHNEKDGSKFFRELEKPNTASRNPRGWKFFIRVDAWPITSHGLSYFVWCDSRRVLRFIERLAQGGV